MTTENSITLVVPARNEEANLELAVSVMVAAVEPQFDDYEILIFNDGSTDRTGAIADALATGNPRIRAFHHPESINLGGVIQRGMGLASMRWVMYVDGKGATTREALDTIFAQRGKADLVIPYILNQHERHWFRRAVSNTYRTLLNTLFRLDLKYYNHLVLSETTKARRFVVHTKSYAFQAEYVLKQLKSGSSYVQVGVMDRFDDTGRKTKAFKPRNVLGVGLFLLRTLWEVYVAGIPLRGGIEEASRKGAERNGTGNQEPGTRNREPGIRSQEPGIGNREPRTGACCVVAEGEDGNSRTGEEEAAARRGGSHGLEDCTDAEAVTCAGKGGGGA